MCNARLYYIKVISNSRTTTYRKSRKQKIQLFGLLDLPKLKLGFDKQAQLMYLCKKLF